MAWYALSHLEGAIMSIACLFPGQGSQFIGMGKELAAAFPEARQVFEQVDDALSQKLSQLMFEGAESDLNLTENTQPALMAVSIAVARVLEKQGGLLLPQSVAFMAGHSLGEYAALTAAHALELSDTARMLKLRGQAMQRAVPVGQGAMAAILGLDFDVVHALASESAVGSAVCQAANDNAPGQVVVSGHVQAVEHFVALATAKGAKRAIMLPVSAPFHCTLMAPAAAEMAKALAQIVIRPPQCPIVANVTAKAETDPNAVRQLLVDQITGRVRWRESVEYMAAQGVTTMIELGAGKVLCGLVKRIATGVATLNVSGPADIEAALAVLQQNK